MLLSEGCASWGNGAGACVECVVDFDDYGGEWREATTEMITKRNLWQRFHHMAGHLLVGLSNGQLWAWRFHDWTWHKAWPEADDVLPQRWRGLE